MPPLNDKKLDKIQKLLEIANEDFATPAEVIQAIEGVLNIINTERDRINALIEAKSTQGEALNAKTLKYLDEKEKGLKYLISELGRSYSDDNALTVNKFLKEVKRLEKKIPNKVDLTEIIAKIESLQEGINNFSTELTSNPEAIRDALELLQGDERLDKSAIRGLDELIDDLRLLSRTGQPQAVGVRLLRYLSDVNIEGITDGQGIAWDSATQRFIPVTLGGGGGGSVTVEDLTLNGTAIFVSANLAKWIDTDTGHYYEGFGYTKAGSGPYTYELDLRPNTFAKLVY